MEIRTYSALVVSSSEKFNSSLFSVFSHGYYEQPVFASSINEAKRCMINRDYDFIMINSPLPDDMGTRFACDCVVNTDSVVLIFLKSDSYDGLHEKLKGSGVLTLRKPTSFPMVEQSVDFMCALRERIRTVRKRSLNVEEKMKEIRLVNRAKWLLIDKLKMTEPDAHRYIEKQAMDRCVSKSEISENIISTYE